MIGIVDRHALAGFRCVDAITQSTIQGPLVIAKTALGLRQNRSGIFAVMDAPGVKRSDTQVLMPVSWPPPAAFEITIQDPSLRYLARRANIWVPQPLPPPAPLGATLAPPVTTTTPATTTTIPATATTGPGAPTTTAAAPPTTSTTGAPAATTTPAPGPTPPPFLTTPQTITLYPTPNAPVSNNWAVVRAVVSSNATPPQALAGAVIQVAVPGGATASGVTDQKGEALLAVPGLGMQLSTSGASPVMEATTAATAKVWFDPGSLAQPRGWVSNPDDILLNLSSTKWKSTSQPVTLTRGLTVAITFTVSM